MSREPSYHYWLDERIGTYATMSPGDRVLGMFGLVPNRVKCGHHVPNASHMVNPASQRAA